LRTGLISSDGPPDRCRGFERNDAPARPVAQKVADSKGFRGDLNSGIACQPRWFVAEKIVRRWPAGLWMTAAAVQRLAF